VIYPSIGNFIWSKKKHTSGDQKGKNSLQSSKTEFGAQNQYGLVIYLSIGNFTWSKKIILLGVKKAKTAFRAQKRNLGPKNSKIYVRAKKIKTSRHFKKCTLREKTS
jgi:hypothetical protein